MTDSHGNVVPLTDEGGKIVKTYESAIDELSERLKQYKAFLQDESAQKIMRIRNHFI